MAYQVPTLDELLAMGVALFKGLLPDRNIGSRFVPAWKFVKTIAGLATDVNANVQSAVKDVMPDSAGTVGIDRWLKIVSPGGSPLRKGATPARKSNAGRVVGGVGATTVVGDLLVHRASGLQFQINENATVPIAGFIDVDIAGVDVGSKTRLEAGEVLEYIATPVGITTQVELQLALDEDGFDSEQNGAARNRLLSAMSQPTAGGNQNDYVAWATAQTGIAQAFVYPNRAGLGTVDVAALHSGTGTARILTAGEVTALLAILQTLAPLPVGGPGGSLRVLTVLSEVANVEMTITPNGDPQYAMDYDDSAGPATVLVYTPASRTVQLAAARPATMKAGDRIVFRGVGSSQDGTPLTVEALVSTDSFILQETPTVNPAATDQIYAGGPLTKLIRDAVLAHINGDVLYADVAGPLPGANADSTVNLQVLANGIGTSNVNGAYGTWNGTLQRGTLAKIASYTRGVRNQNVVAPVADQDSTDYTFPLDTQIGLLTPGFVLIRRG